MKRRCNKRPEPRTELIGLNLTDADLAQLDELFTLLKPTSVRQRKLRRLTRSTFVRYAWDNRPKRDAKLIGIYLPETDCEKLIKLDLL